MDPHPRRKAVRRNLDESDAAQPADASLFEAAFYASTVPMTISGLHDGRLIAINDACCELMGYDRSEVLGKTIQAVGHIVDEDRAEADARVLQAGGTVSGREVQFRRRNGELAWGWVTASIVQRDHEPCLLTVVADITHRLSAEAALRSSEARLAGVFNAAGVMMVVSRLGDGKVVDVNRAFLEQSGYSREDVVGRTAYEIGVFADPADGERIDRALREQGQVRDLEISVARTDGLLGYALLSADIVELDGEPHLITAAVDNTARREASEALRASEERYRDLIEQTVDGVLLLDDNGRILDVNPALAEFAGRAADEMRGTLWTDYIDPENLVETPFQRPEYSAGKPAVFERRVRRPDGSVAELEIHARRLANGTMLGTARDIGARKAAERERARLIQAIEQSADSIIITDVPGTIVYVNPAVEQSTGLRRDQIVGQNYRVLRGEPLSERQYQDVKDMVVRRGRWTGELSRRFADGSVRLESVSAAGVRDQSGAIVNYVVVRRDITRERELEDQLRQAQKMEAVGRLAGGVAHDFNNLLTAISGFAELAAAEAAPGSEMAQYLNEICRSTDRATALTRQLLAFGRRAVLNPEVLDLNQVVTDIAPMLRRIIGENIRLELQPDPALKRIKADRGQLEQVVVNLAANARDAMPNGGTMAIATENAVLDDAPAGQHGDVPPGEYVRLSIADTGEGMDPETVERIFEPFFTTRGQSGGVGLGLATVFGIVRQSGGVVHVRSERDRGSVFVIELPVAEEAVVQDPAQPRDPVVAVGRETVLVVEDEPAVLSFAAQLLGRNGYTVLQASSGEEAVEIARTHAGQIDLLFSDLVMPGLTGQQTAAAIRAMRPAIRQLFSSGYSEEVNVGGEATGAPFVAKPYTAAALLVAVREALARG
jgi:two-component system cell cycle sensor histidine kinase/response regulator CckA